jgi:ribose 5-phosphate isomerase B
VGKVDRGLLVCGTGLGMAIAANKIAGVRAVACSDLLAARMSREHNDANVLALGGRLLGREAALEILGIWLETPFAGGRHVQRVDKIAALERRRGAERHG